MPNPFPGMNPYLENPRRWRMVHNGLIYGFNAALAEQLPPGFSASTDERVYVEGWGKEYIPDALVIQTHPVQPHGNTSVLIRPSEAGTVASSPTTLDFGALTTRERFIEIRTTDEREELIAVVEFLSPTNKTGGPGRDEYQSKQRDLLGSGVHLLEIDLLRGGDYSLAPPEGRTRAYLGPFDYLVSLHRGSTQARFDLWPIKLRDRLPDITVPLTEEVPPVVVNLQDVVNRIYLDGGHDRLIRYEEEPVPPLLPEDAAWLDTLLKERGLRQINAGAVQ